MSGYSTVPPTRSIVLIFDRGVRQFQNPNHSYTFESVHVERRTGSSLEEDASNFPRPPTMTTTPFVSTRRVRIIIAPYVFFNTHCRSSIILHVDVLFLNRHYAQAQSRAYASAPRAFLLALTCLAPPHTLLVAYWGADGTAALSVLAREYFQSSGWSAPPTPVASASSPSSSLSTTTIPSTTTHGHHHPHSGEVHSVRSGSGFWAAGHVSSQGGQQSILTP